MKREQTGQSPPSVTYKQFRVRKCKEPPKDRRKVHLITILLLVMAHWGRLERNIRTQQACSDSSTEYSPKIQGFMAQVFPKDNGGNFVFRSPWQIFIVNFPILSIYTFTPSPAKMFCSLITYCIIKNLSFALNFLPPANFI